MSITNDLCDLCGREIDPLAGENAQASGSTGKLWCGDCGLDLKGPGRQAILVWLYSAERVLELIKVGPMTPAEPFTRPDWDDYYLGIAKAVSARGDCARRQHGAVVVKNHKIVATGYNGTPAGDSRSCGATGQCPRNLDPSAEHGKGEYDLCWASHAEANALLRASWEELQGSTIYITGPACPGCTKLIQSSGVVRIVTPDTV
jgi:dCMP deaminase